MRAGLLEILFVPLLVFFVSPVFALIQDGCNKTGLFDNQNCDQGNTVRGAVPVIADKYGDMPLVFEVNQGQLDEEIKFMARGSGYNLYLTPAKIMMALYRPLISSKENSIQHPLVQRLDMDLPGASSDVQIIGTETLPGKSNYFTGNDPNDWHSGIKQYKNAKYLDIYPGIDLVFYGNKNKIEYDFVVKPGATYKNIRLKYEGMQGIRMDENGNLILHTGIGDLMQHAPYAYQVIGGNKIQVKAKYVIQNETGIGFHVGDYDHSKTLIIDPVISYSTYLGGTLADTATDIAIDAAGNAYITGYTLSTDFDTASAVNPSKAGSIDVFISKINASGSSLVYSTYLGGTGADWGYGISVDSSGAAAIAGITASADFPVVSAIQSGYGGSNDGFVTKLNAAGSAIVYSTYIGGTNNDEARDITFNINGEIYITGYTSSADFPVVSGFQLAKSGPVDAFISKINAAGSAFIYSSFLGGSNGSGEDYSYAIAADNNDNAYIAGTTASTNFPVTASPIQGTYGGGVTDVFVAKIHPLGSSVLFATYLGGSGNDVANGIDVDGNENVYVTGVTTSTNFPVVYSSLDSTCGTDGNCNGGRSDAFVIKIQAAGSALAYGTYLGGSDNDIATDIAVNSSGSAFVTGYTSSGDFPSISAVQSAHGGVIDAFIARLNASGTELEYSTFLGGSGGDSAQGIAVDDTGYVYVVGNTASTNFPTASPLQASLAGNTDVFITKIGSITDLWVTINDTIDPVAANADFGYTIIVTNNGPDTAHNTMLTDILPSGLSFVSASSTQGSCSGTSTITCNLGLLAGGASIIITLDVRASQTIINTVNITSSDSDSDTTNNIDSEQTVITSSSSVTGITASDGGGGSGYGLFMMLLVFATIAFLFKIRFISKPI